MKCFRSIICIGILLAAFAGCKKDNDKKSFNYERAAGLWVPYELIDKFGTIQTGLDANSIFGAYAESVQLKKDKTFIPVIWNDKNNITFKSSEKGTFEYLSNNKLKFNGIWELECSLIKFEGDDLWLQVHEDLYKFKRQL